MRMPAVGVRWHFISGSEEVLPPFIFFKCALEAPEIYCNVERNKLKKYLGGLAENLSNCMC